MGKSGEIIAGKWSPASGLAAGSHSSPSIRRCKTCGVRKVLSLGFYRDRTSRGGYRRECKRCRNRKRALWARERYRPKTGRRYRTGADRRAV
ncbi:MAG: hypothetical protein M3348_14055 [Acidobacteriota bacterium]|nr:hypothetical protein [Acidobacteriota bacterium]